LDNGENRTRESIKNRFADDEKYGVDDVLTKGIGELKLPD
jgi:hypothetical protein